MSYVLGIDLGTTYSAAAVDSDGRGEVFQLGTRGSVIPSIVVLRADGEILTGEVAERRAQSEPTRTAREFKRRLGDPAPLILGGTPYGADAIISLLLRAVVAQVAQQRGEPPALICITHPASYGPYKLDLLRQAVRQADCEDAIFLAEPEAAALHYAAQERVEPGTIIGVYDFGGGTFDAAVLRKTDEGFEMLGQPEGLERLGGIDFDEAVFQHVARSLGGAIEGLDPSNPAAQAGVARLREECQRAKEALSDDTEAVIQVLLPNAQSEVRITRGEFESIIRPRVGETIAALERSVRSAGLTMDQLDRILLVGGTSRIPLVAALVQEMTGRPVALDAHPKHAIALGAASEARRRLAADPSLAVQPTASTAPAAAAAPAAAPAPEPETRDEPSAPAQPAEPPVAATSSTAVPPATAPPAAAAAADVRVQPGAPAVSAQAGNDADAPVDVATAAAAPSMAAAPPSRPPGPPRSRMRMYQFGGGAAVVAVLVAAGAFFLLGGGDSEGAGNANPTNTPTVEGVSTSSSELEVVTPTAGPTNTPTVPPPTATPTLAPNTSRITDVRVAAGRYEVEFETAGFVPAVPGQHVHFFFDTVPPEQAGVPGAGPWILYGGPSPFTQYSPADRPAGASQMCILVANPDHSVNQGTGNCFDLPD